MVGWPSVAAVATGEERCLYSAYTRETVAIGFCIVSVYQMLGNMNLCSKCLSNMHSSDVFPSKETVLRSFETTN